jgi:hypothetical protein
MNLLGLDPGGLKRFGWAHLRIGDSGTPIALNTGVSSSASAALNEASRAAGVVPVAIGIDVPLFWVAEGDRRADARIRKLVCAAGAQSGMSIRCEVLAWFKEYSLHERLQIHGLPRSSLKRTRRHFFASIRLQVSFLQCVFLTHTPSMNATLHSLHSQPGPLQHVC